MKKIALIYSDYYKEVTDGLISGFLKNVNTNDWQVDNFKVYGVSEFPYFMNKILKESNANYDAFAFMGCVIEGETYHNSLINNYVYNKLYDLSVDSLTPIGYGILNVKNLNDALNRSIDNDDNRGLEAYFALKHLLS